MKFKFDYTNYIESLVPLFKTLESMDVITSKKLAKLIKMHAKEDGNVFSKEELTSGYRNLAGKHGLKPQQRYILDNIKMKPTRTQSGVAPITVLTKPFPCPGKCIFCPSDVRMPKSYLSDEPGAQRAERNWFDPYMQTYNRLQALENIGHSVSKAELIILGGTWSYYPEKYQIWFIKECFRALNDFGKRDDRDKIEEHYSLLKNLATNVPSDNKESFKEYEIEGDSITKTYNQTVSQLYVAPEKIRGFDHYQTATWEELIEQQKINETAAVRSVGLVIETRPDNISEQEVIRIRKLGCTKAQIGFQSLNDDVLTKNHRGHLIDATKRAVRLLRLGGFKIHAHWMANLYGSSVEKDKQDFKKLFSDINFRPDELKIYPCSLIGSAELMQYYKKGSWKPFEYEELLDVLSFCLLNTPQYCRLTRVIRDIPSQDIIEGNKLSNFRQIAEQKLEKAGQKSIDIRAREIRNSIFDPNKLVLDEIKYKTSTSKEIFLQYILKAENNGTNKIVAFLRLSLPTEKTFIKELENSAIIREIHVYGTVVDIGKEGDEKAQHLGLGKKLIERAMSLAQENKYKNLAVISAVGTREYYRNRGFNDGELYQSMELTKTR
ncbi:MAG: histone acetyltransferase [Candidatus Pacebacteria bacterium CG_4_10_14_3_um_filter_34_15]|nr:tRNA uridine(34) 5-carboxymethylaminomethyl modification radical SAM/GNAT enzyme Elp3 [Candidatus Pacearchaeota archaeon]NCQ66085.1 tRNA uridine(34) 5-carboxymethylaminomethyl modification radical SAM/GNAT enzyme Elp3 [Candidatus Paceibacterota bacterium]PIQ81100.1 MAG: histone acetyltransferase [Candidatus Pacebacteria bacterium CG11_big_fil_rev_8_21_14_0_20_34_55]PIX81550.1 MAG: histone acetyltransferase [Candidatus Pacebacteria bacterium CG_4_10_14_3_um_filter_34_15]PJC43937.1 MAG: histon